MIRNMVNKEAKKGAGEGFDESCLIDTWLEELERPGSQSRISGGNKIGNLF